MIKVRTCIRLFITFILLTAADNVFSQNLNRVSLDNYQRNTDRRVFHIPDLPGFVTLTGDFHMHSIFSDGHLWPEFRVREAWKEGLDVISISDHIEYLPHKDYTLGDHNVSFEIALSSAEQLNIILIKAAEITRSMPPGHLNALFLDDANLLDKDDPMTQIEEAVKQGAFVFWNHPGWASQQPDTTKWWEYHTTLLEKGWLHGVEVANGGNWYPIVLDWCKEKKLTALANSDVHVPIDYSYDLSLPNSHRPMTLLISKDRTEEGVREALFSRRTVGFVGDQLMGPEELILGLFHAAVKIHPPYLTTGSGDRALNYRELENPTDLTFILEAEGEGSMTRRIELRPNSMTVLRQRSDGEKLRYRLVNCWTGSQEHPVVQLD